MKKQAFTLFLLIHCFFLFAQHIEVDGITYNIVSEVPPQVEVWSQPEGYVGDIVLPEMVQWDSVMYLLVGLGNSAFYGCHELTSLFIPETVTYFGQSVFTECTGLTTLEFSAYLTSIDKFCFVSSTSMLSFFVADDNPVYASLNGVLYTKDTTRLISYPAGLSGEFIVPEPVTVIGSTAFYECAGLTSVTFPSGLITIDLAAFRGCSGLSAILISDAVETIDRLAFSSCTSLSLVDLGNSVTTIQNNAFEYCTQLTSISLPASVETLGFTLFSGCPNMQFIHVDPENLSYSSLDGVLYNKSQTQILQFPEGRTGSFILPETVSVVGNYCFENCTGLTSITLPQSLQEIWDHGFYGCEGLTEINFPDYVTYIDGWAFGWCTGLTTLTFGPYIEAIEYGAFMGCALINEVTCCAPEPPAIAYTTFFDIPDSTTLFVPTEKVSLYKATPEWNQFKISGTENCGYVSIDEHLSDNISIFPNPFDDQITITLPGNTEGYVQLFNLKGMPIMSNSIEGYSQILLKTLSPGIYFYRIRNNQNVVSGKLIMN